MGQANEILKAALAAKGLPYVGIRGDRRSRVVFVGEAAGEQEALEGYPFVGPSGQELDREIRDSGLSHSDVWFTNPYKTRPPDNKLPKLVELGVDATTYEAQFWEELGEAKPTFIVACGKTPTNLLCPETIIHRRGKEDEEGVSFSHWRGSLLTSPFLSWPHYVVPMYHPAFILRNYVERDINVFIISRVKEEFDYFQKNGKIQPLPERTLVVEPNIGQALDILRGMLHANKPVSVDIEMLRRKVPYTIGLSNDIQNAISICLWDYSNSDSIRLWMYLGAILRKLSLVGQNFTTFDAPWLRAVGLPANIQNTHDTLIRHHVLWPELSHKLEFQVMQYTREPFFKEEGKGWQASEGKAKLMRYNCKDACTTLEIYQKQEEELDEKGLREFYTKYEMPLARSFYDIDTRGILVDLGKKKEVRDYINSELQAERAKMVSPSGKRIVTSLKEAPRDLKREDMVLLSYHMDVLQLLRDCGIKPKTKVKWHKGEATSRESTEEDVLNELYAETSHPILQQILRVRELEKIRGTYVDQRLFQNISYTNYNVAGTLGGRRSARRNTFHFGSNHQNQPKHSDLGLKYREMLVARPGKIFVFCDQVQAEDWIVNGLIVDNGGSRAGLDELLHNVDRHQNLASTLLGLPKEQCGKGSHARYIGKKVRHAGNYEMGANRMSLALAKEGVSIASSICEKLLEKFHATNPDIRGVFHRWVESCIRKDRGLRSPLGRSRTFFGVHPYRDNSKLFKEAYSYVPQTTVGDNTGKAILFCEQRKPGVVLYDGHDAVGLEVAFELDEVSAAMNLLDEAFNRVIRFQNGLELKIPIEFELGFDFRNLKTCANSSKTGLQSIWDGLVQQANLRSPISSGVPQPVSQAV